MSRGTRIRVSIFYEGGQKSSLERLPVFWRRLSAMGYRFGPACVSWMVREAFVSLLWRFSR